MSVIEVTNLTKYYGKSRGIVDVSFSEEEGEIFGFIGPNGAGKTTAIKCLVGLQAPTGGEAFLLGRSIRDAEARRSLGFLPERPYFYQHLTAAEFLDFYGQLFDIPARTRRARAASLLERVGLSESASTPLRQFSKGMLQRAGIAQALISDPELIILDEPMSGLDPLGRMLVRDLILAEGARGRTVFFSSHILSDVQSICDRVGLIVAGRLRAIGAIGELLSGQVEHVDCTVIVPEGVPLVGTRVAAKGSERIQRLPPDDLDRLVDQVRAAGGRLVEVLPNRRSLESLLLDELARAQDATSPREASS